MWNLRAISLVGLVAILFGCRKELFKREERHSNYDVRGYKSSAVADSVIKPYQKKVWLETSKTVVWSSAVITREGEQSSLGNFICDALGYSAPKMFPKDSIDVIIFNRGGMRNNLPEGEIKVMNIFELMPFENQMVLLKIKGRDLRKALLLVVEKKHPFAGMKLYVENRELKKCEIGNSILHDEKVYSIITSDYLANGGDGFTCFTQPLELKQGYITIRQALIDYCSKIHASGQKLTPYLDERLQVTK